MKFLFCYNSVNFKTVIQSDILSMTCLFSSPKYYLIMYLSYFGNDSMKFGRIITSWSLTVKVQSLAVKVKSVSLLKYSMQHIWGLSWVLLPPSINLQTRSWDMQVYSSMTQKSLKKYMLCFSKNVSPFICCEILQMKYWGRFLLLSLYTTAV